MDRPAEFVSPSRRLRIGLGAGVAVVVAALALTVGIGVLRGAAESGVTAVPSSTVSPQSGDLYVHVAGAVATPGLYVLPAGARVSDAVTAAGGFTDDALRDGVNLARSLADGEQLVVPAVGAATDASAPGAAGDPRIDLNTADAATLEGLPRIGPALAERIVAWREENGRFSAVEDLLQVTGIGDKLFAGLKDLVRV